MDNQVIYDLLKEVRDEQRNLSEKNIEHREEAIKWQTEAGTRLSNIEEDLREHKEGVVQNRSSIKVIYDRLANLEEPEKAKEYFRKSLLKISGVVGALTIIIGTIGKILNKW